MIILFAYTSVLLDLNYEAEGLAIKFRPMKFITTMQKFHTHEKVLSGLTQ